MVVPANKVTSVTPGPLFHRKIQLEKQRRISPGYDWCLFPLILPTEMASQNLILCIHAEVSKLISDCTTNVASTTQFKVVWFAKLGL